MLRFLANENFPREAVIALRGLGHEVAWVRDERPGISDEVVLAWAGEEARILLTFDKDFGELVYRRGGSASAGVILFRILTRSSAEAVAKIVVCIQSRVDWAGHFTVVEDERVRMSRLP